MSLKREPGRVAPNALEPFPRATDCSHFESRPCKLYHVCLARHYKATSSRFGLGGVVTLTWIICPGASENFAARQYYLH